MTLVDFKKIGYKDEPFILAKDVMQVFYVKDMASKPKKNQDKFDDEPKHHIVLLEKEKSLELKTFRTSQKTLINLMTVLHSRSMLTPASCYPKRTLLASWSWSRDIHKKKGYQHSIKQWCVINMLYFDVYVTKWLM